MKHAIPVKHYGALGKPMAEAVQACVHCGFCLPACPTYQVMGEEMDSPRGRIILMKQVLEGTLPLAEALPHVDACLGCLSCETACPSGVQYRDLISPFRALAESQRDRPLIERIRRWLLLQTLPKSELFQIVAMLGVMVRPFRKLIPGPLRAMLELMPAALPKSEALLDHYIPLNKPSARVALLAGCAQQVLAPEINKATIDVLVSNGVEVIVPRRQSCCGALAWHVGEAAMAAECAKENLWAFPDDVDAILTNAAGCGSCLHEYPLILRGTKHEENARRFASRSIDASRYICGLNLNAPIGFDHPVSVVMQDACHLLHGQNVRDEPRRLIAQVPNVTLHEIADAEICCGSAGTYNLDHPDTAAELGRRKARQIIASGAEIVLSGNIGCLTQLQAHLSALKSEITVMHTIVFLRAAYEGRLPQGV